LRGGKAATGAIVLLVTLAGSVAVSAHRKDEYLQAARLGVEPGRVDVELDLTPGIAVADAIIAEIDRDGDGALSTEEQRKYVADVLGAVRMQVDGTPVRLEPVASTFAQIGAMRRGEGTIQLRTAAALPPLPSGRHQLVFRNQYRPHVSAYLSNALVPASSRISIATQQRNDTQSVLSIDYVMQAERSHVLPAWLAGLMAAVAAAVALWLRPRGFK